MSDANHDGIRQINVLDWLRMNIVRMMEKKNRYNCCDKVLLATQSRHDYTFIGNILYCLYKFVCVKI